MLFGSDPERSISDARLILSAIFCLALSFLQPPRAVLAQSPVDGAVAGTVLDASHAVVAGAKIEIDNLANGLQASTTTDARGIFLIPRVPAGEYHLTAEAAGFRRIDISPIIVELGSVANLVLPLSISGTSISIDAEDQGTPTDAEPYSGGSSQVFSYGEIDRLPIDGRQWQSFALLSPQANLDGDDDASLISFRGIPSTQNSTEIDGVADDQSFAAAPRGSAPTAPPQDADSASQEAADDTGRSFAAGNDVGQHSAAAYTFSQSAVQEFRVGAQNYSAMQGHAAGGTITTISRSGTDHLHGSVSYLVRSNALAATNPFSVATHYNAGVVTSGLVKPYDLRQQYGGTVGGPIIKDKLFYFYTFDGQYRDFPAVSTPATANFYALTPIQTALLSARGVSPGRVSAALSYLDSLSGLVPRRSDQTINFAKLDWQVSPRHRFTFQFNRVRSSSPAGVRQGAVVSRGVASLGNSALTVDSALARWLWSQGSRLSNETRFQYGRDLRTEEPQLPLPQEPAVGPGGYAPEISIGPNGFIFGTPASLGRRAYPDERRLELADVLTFNRGHHLLQAGADVSFVHDSLQSLQNQEGTFAYDSGTTNGRAGGLVDWITDYTFNVSTYPNGACPSITAAVHDFCFRSFTQSFGQQAVSFHTEEWSGFLQDTWRIRPGLTLGAGLRYEYELLPIPQQPNFAIDAVFGAKGATGIFPEDRNNFGPRASLVWQPFGSGHGLARIGYGLYYGRLPGAMIRSALVNTATPTSVTHIRILPTTVTTCPQVANQGFGYPCAYDAAPPAAIANTTSATVFDRRFRLPALQEGSVGLERELPGGFVTSATYLLSLERQLSNSVDINIAPSTGSATFQLQGGATKQGVRTGETFVVPLYTQRLSSSFGPITDILSNGNGSYNALLIEARRSGFGDLDLRGSWTWSKAIDFGQSTGAVPRTNAQFDPFTNRYDKALSPLNYPQKVVVAAVWHPTFSSSDRLLRAAGNGWLLAPIFTESSGRPYSYDIFGGTRLTGGHESINGAGGAVYLPTVGPNVLRLPNRWRLDLRLSREFPIHERFHLRVAAEAFNLTNHVAYSGVTQRAFLVGFAVSAVTPLVFQDAPTITSEGLNTQPFGTFTEAASGNARERQVQLGLHLEF